MGKKVRPSLVAALLALLVVALSLVGCGDSGQATATITQPTATVAQQPAIIGAEPTVEKQETGNKVPPQIEIVEVKEATSYRDAIIKGLGNVTWYEPVGGDGGQETTPKDIALAAIKSEGIRLAAVNYVNLALDDYKEVTGKLKLTDKSFQSGEIVLDATGKINGETRFLLFGFTGPALPQRPDRLQVFRWIQTYALYDINNFSIIRLVATIRGEVHE